MLFRQLFERDSSTYTYLLAPSGTWATRSTSSSFADAEGREGMDAFIEKRLPSWKR